MPQPRRAKSRQESIHLLDTNVLLRYLIGDDPPKAARATALMARVEDAEEIVEISEAVLTETVWVLDRFYKVPRSDIAQRLVELLSFAGMRVGARGILVLALETFAGARARFVDCVLAAQSRLTNVPVYTFDETDFNKLRVDWQSP